jgi:uncharacterized RDD family membrane protein YckC
MLYCRLFSRETHVSPEASQPPHCGLLRRLAAILYDGLLLLAVLFIATAILLPLTHQAGTTPGEAPVPIYAQHPLYKAAFTSYLFMVSYFFFAYFWTHGGQTLGMRAWRIRVQTRDGHPIGWWHALLRFMVAIVSWAALGLGFLWSLVDRQKRTWHDLYSETDLIVLPKE